MNFQERAQMLVPQTWFATTYETPLTEEQVQRAVTTFRELTGKTVNLRDAHLFLACAEHAKNG